jgi:hypothetical protein
MSTNGGLVSANEMSRCVARWGARVCSGAEPTRRAFEVLLRDIDTKTGLSGPSFSRFMHRIWRARLALDPEVTAVRGLSNRTSKTPAVDS